MRRNLGSLLILLVTLVALVAGCTESITYNTYITVNGVRCFIIIMPDQSTVNARDVTANGNGTWDIGHRTFTINTNCEASPVTTTTHTPMKRSGPPGL